MAEIEFLKKPYSPKEILATLEPEVKGWFLEKFPSFTPPQRYSIVEIAKGKNLLISSPTGSGKTLSAFLTIINKLIKLSKRNLLQDRIYAIYISPLRALNNDIHRNLEKPLREIEERARKDFGIRIAVRTSDTTPSQKAKMLRKPPHILITTPESFAISLNSPRFSQLMANTDYVIVDEIHALAGNKRGAHLSISLERLEKIRKENGRKKEITRIGLSATVYPLEEVAKFLVGNGRKCKIVDVRFVKPLEIKVISPVDDFIYISAEEINKRLYSLLASLIRIHNTTLIFTNTRSGTERVVYHLKKLMKEERIAAHHSSLSREIRLGVEESLKKEELKAVVSSTSLELGIDIGSIDLVVLLGSPKSTTRALQRIGRSGHRLEETSRGYIIALDRDDLVEDTIIAKNALEKKLDSIRIPDKPLDVLAQHVLGMALRKKWGGKEAYNVVKKAYPYKKLSFEEFERVLSYLAGEYAQLEERNIYAKIWYDEGSFGRRGKLTRVIYYMNTGTIPDESMVVVRTTEGKYIGKVEEEFAERLIPGDIFVLGGRTYEFLRGRGNVIYVKDAEGKKPTIPAWFSEMLPLAYETALSIEKFREKIAKMINEKGKRATIQYLLKNYPIEKHGAEAIVKYIEEQKRFAEIPGKKVVVEEYIDEDGLLNYIFHFCIGRKANEGLARVFGKILSEKKSCNARITFNDYGIMITLPPEGRIKNEREIKELFNIDEKMFHYYLERSLEGSEMLRRRFRNVATRGLAILRRYPKRKKELSVTKQQISADALLKIIKRYYPDFPMLEETYKEIKGEAMHVDESLDYLKKIKKKEIVFFKERTVPSPFAFLLAAEGAKDVVVMEDRKKFIQKLHRKLMERMGYVKDK